MYNKKTFNTNQPPSQILRIMSSELSGSRDILNSLRYELELSVYAHDEEGAIHRRRDLGIHLFLRAEYVESTRNLKEAAHGFKVLGDDANRAVVMLYLGMIHERVGDYIKAIECYDVCREICADYGDEEGSAIVMEGLGGVYVSLGEFSVALDFLQRSMNIHDGAGNHELAGLCAMEIASIHGRLRNFSEASGLLQSSLEKFRACGSELLEIRALSNLAALYSAGDKLDESLEYGLRALLAYEALGDISSQIGALVTVGHVYVNTGHHVAALDCMSKALRLADTWGDRHLLAEVLMAIGGLHDHSGHLWKAIAYVERALAIAESVEDRHLELRASEFLATAFESVGEVDRALQYQKASAQIRMDMAENERRRTVAELLARFDIERIERDLILSRARHRELERDLEHKMRENATMALNLVRKAELLDAVRGKVEKIRNGVHDADDELESLLHRIADDGRFEEDWRTFESQLSDADREFVGVISRKFPSLTPEELKVCLLLKANLTTKQIASLRFVSNRTVENQRFRIREKLGLSPRANLLSFLTSL